MRRVASWMFGTPREPVTFWRVVLWWELRRIPFNVIIGTYGLVCLIVFFWAIQTSGHLQPGEDAVEPIALLFAPFGINILYTLGSLAELGMRLRYPALSARFAPALLAV